VLPSRLDQELNACTKTSQASTSGLAATRARKRSGMGVPWSMLSSAGPPTQMSALVCSIGRVPNDSIPNSRPQSTETSTALKATANTAAR
jgi:hypothetical protein